MINLNDLKNIDRFLEDRSKIKFPGDTDHTKRIIHTLRSKIAQELSKIKVEIDKEEELRIK